MMYSSKRVVLSVVLLGLILIVGAGFTKKQSMLQVLFTSLNNWHVKPKRIEDPYSKNVFASYIKRLDHDKRFFLESDITQLKLHQTTIDDQIRKGKNTFYTAVQEIYKKRLLEAKQRYKTIIKEPLSLTANQVLETDPEKRKFCRSEEEANAYWHKLVRYHYVLNCLTELEAQKKDKAIAVTTSLDAKVTQKAIESTKKNFDLYFQRLEEATAEDHHHLFLDTLMNVYDSHTSYFPKEKKEDFDINISGKLEGIGAVLREDNGLIKVIKIVAGSAAWRQGDLKAEDLILKVAQGDAMPVDLVGSRVRDAVKLIRGKKGSEVRLTIKKPSGKIQIISIIRDIVVIEETYAKSTLIKDERYQKKYGYIYLPKFYRDFQDSKGRNSTDDIRRILETFKGHDLEGVLLDLRHNEGGALLDAINVAGLFIKDGPIVQVKSRGNKRLIHYDKDQKIYYDGPLVVMINKFSASASEILAAALQDYHRAIIVGTSSSFGKGTVQTFIDLDQVFPDKAALYRPLGSLKLTIQKFYRVNGDSTQYKGVMPDILYPDEYGDLEVGEKYLDYSLPWSRISSVPHSIWPYQQLNVKRLRKKSEQRWKKTGVFDNLNTHISFIQKERKKTVYPLHLEEAIEKRNKIDEESEHYKNSRAILPFFTFIDSKTGKEHKEQEDWHKTLLKDLYLAESISIVHDIELYQHKIGRKRLTKSQPITLK